MTEPSEALLLTMKRASAVLRSSGIPFALVGSFAVYARGGVSSEHDVDFLIKREDADRALEALRDAGFSTAVPPEDWLVKAYDEGRLVDLIFRPVEQPVTDETLAQATVMAVRGVHVPVMPATSLMNHKLLALSQHYCDYGRVLPLARSLREQIDWDAVRSETKESPYAQAFLVLLELLHVLPVERS